MPNLITCKECGFTGSPSEFPPCASVYHDFRCPHCGTTHIDTSALADAEYGYGAHNTLRLPVAPDAEEPHSPCPPQDHGSTQG